ncbi:MAG: hypothetical protein Q9224_006140, partial [Gallowayella concinna]
MTLPGTVAYEHIEYLRTLLDGRDGLEVTDADESLTLYISPSRACARRDVGVGFSSSSRQTPLMMTSGGVSSDPRPATRMSSAPVTTPNPQAAPSSVSVITAVDDQLHPECTIDPPTEVRVLGGSGGDGEHNDDNDELPGASARYSSQDCITKVTNQNRQRLVVRAQKQDRRQ